MVNLVNAQIDQFIYLSTRVLNVVIQQNVIGPWITKYDSSKNLNDFCIVFLLWRFNLLEFVAPAVFSFRPCLYRV